MCLTGRGGDNTKEHCASRLDRGMFWNWTMVGETAKQACPGGASGLARWKCVENHQNNNLPMWFPESPDLSDCKSAWLMSLQVSLNDLSARVECIFIHPLILPDFFFLLY